MLKVGGVKVEDGVEVKGSGVSYYCHRRNSRT